MKEVDRSWDKDSEDTYYVNDKKIVVHGDTVTVPEEFAEAIEASKVKYPKREVPADSGSSEPIIVPVEYDHAEDMEV